MTAPITRVPPVARGQTPSDSFRARGTGASHCGCVREINEDAILLDPSGEIWAVADGMGGYEAGDIASELTITALEEAHLSQGLCEGLVAALTVANTKVRQAAVARDAPGMGATVVALAFGPTGGAVVWSGDARAYVWRGYTLKQITNDHSLVQSLIEVGSLSPQMAAHHPEANVVTKAIGGTEALDAETRLLDPAPDDRFLLCSDGLTAVLTDAQIEAQLGAMAAPEETVDRLISEALAAGAPDNVSAIVVDIEPL